MDNTRRIAGLFNQALIPCEPTDQILSHLWAKVFYNAPLNPLGALLQVHYSALSERAELKAVMDEIIEEAFEVARGKGVRLLWKSADEYHERFYGRACARDLQPSKLDAARPGKRAADGD